MEAIKSFIDSFDSTISVSRAVHEVAKDNKRSKCLRDSIIYERYIQCLREGGRPDSIKHDLSVIYELSFRSIKDIIRRKGKGQ